MLATSPQSIARILFDSVKGYIKVFIPLLPIIVAYIVYLGGVEFLDQMVPGSKYQILSAIAKFVSGLFFACWGVFFIAKSKPNPF